MSAQHNSLLARDLSRLYQPSIPEQLHLNLSRGVLLYPDPQKGPQIIEDAHASGTPTLEKLEEDVNDDQVPSELDMLRLDTVHNQLVVDGHIEVYDSTRDEQYEAEYHPKLQPSLSGPQKWRQGLDFVPHVGPRGWVVIGAL